MSIDPVTFMDTGDTGQFNRYTYANNDPINMIDPNGEDAFRILVGEAGLNEHNVGRNFSRAANTRAQQLRAGGHTVEIRNVGTRQEFAQGFRSETPIDGGVIYMGHSNNASLFVGENSGRDTNFSYEDASSLQGHDLAEGATIELNSCFSGAGDTAVAAHISAWTERSVVAPTTSMGFTGTEGEYLSGAGARPPETGPIYMEPMPNGELRTFDPPD